MKRLKDTEDEDTQSCTKVGSSWLARLPLVYDLTLSWLLEEPLQEEEEMAEEREALPPPMRAEAVFQSH